MISPPAFAAQFDSSVRLHRQYQRLVRAARHERGQFLVSEGGAISRVARHSVALAPCLIFQTTLNESLA
jgi:hypothetical protein